MSSVMMSPFGGLGGSPFGAFGGFGGPSLMMSAMGGGSPFGAHNDLFGGGLMGMGMGMGGGGMTAGTSMSTRFVNGKKITTKKTFANGVETVKTYENDVLVSHTVNGEPVVGTGDGVGKASSNVGSASSGRYHRHHPHRRM